MLHTAGPSASSSRPPHESATLHMPAAEGQGPASLPGRSDGDATGPARPLVRPQGDVPSARMARASTIDPGLEASEAQRASGSVTEPHAPVKAVIRNIEDVSPVAQDSAASTKRPPFVSTEKVPRAAVIDAASSAAQKSPTLQVDPGIDFDFGDLLDAPDSSTSRMFPSIAVPKRGSLVRHMSARSDAGSDAGTPCEHHVNAAAHLEHN